MKKILMGIMLSCIFVFQLAIHGWAAPDTQKNQIMSAAAKEGSLELVWSAGTIGGSNGVKRLEKTFNQYYGLDIKFNFTPGPSMGSMAAKVAQEYAAGQPSQVDVYLGSEGHYIRLLRAKALQSIDWQGIFGVPEKIILAERIGVEVATRVPGVVYNSNLIPADQIPHRMAGFLEPRWKGKLASTAYAINFDRLSSSNIWGVQKTVDYVTKLSSQISGLIRCSELERIVSGEFEAFVMSCGGYEVRKFKALSAPLEHVVPDDAALIAYWNMGVPKNAKHPNAAKLFVNFMISRLGQDTLYDIEKLDHIRIDGSKNASYLKGQGVNFSKMHDTGVQFFLKEGKKIAKTRKKLQAILKKRPSQ